jgi:nitrite reductase/ring-hydroxylating ferredoxin subunit
MSAENPASMRTLAEYVAGDLHRPPPWFLDASSVELGNAPVPADRFTSTEFFDAEQRRLWARVWQVACWECDIPRVGDQISYDIVDQSVVVVRTAPDEVRAFYNTCRHRGTRLVNGSVSNDVIQCPFHAWTWELSGRLARVPCRWDFPNVNDADAGLVEVRAERWNGWIFINFDSEAEPLEAFIGDDMRRQWERWPRGAYRKTGHVGKVVACNWKAALNAFMETYHVFKVHPEGVPYYGDANTQYDVYGPHGRLISPLGTPSPHIGDLDDQSVVDAMLGDSLPKLVNGDGADEVVPPLEQGETARSRLAGYMRSALSVPGLDLSDVERVSDLDVLDGTQYFVFPNVIAWGGYNFPFQYRFRPWGGVDTCLFEIMVLQPVADGAPEERGVPMRMTPSDEPWRRAPELGLSGPLFDQDQENLRKLQLGLKNDSITHIQLANYQERTIRNFFQYLDRYLAQD